MDPERGVRPSTGFKITDIPCDEDASERIVMWFIYVAIAVMVLGASISGWIANSKIEKAREERMERFEERLEKLEKIL